MARVLIAGCGYVGSELGMLLTEDGDKVFGLRRNPRRLPTSIVPVEADLERPETLSRLPSNLDAVVITVSADGRDEAAYRAAYVEGPGALLRALREQGQRPSRVIFTSSTAVYGDVGGDWVDEDFPTRPEKATAKILVEAEQQVLESPFRAVVLRLAGIYGPGRTRLIEQVRDGKAVCGPSPDWTNRIHRDDAAGALRHLLRLRDPAPYFIGCDSLPADRCEVYRWLARRLGVPPPPRDEDAETRGANKRARNDRLVGTGYRMLYPTYREGYGDLIAAERVRQDDLRRDGPPRR